MGEGERSECRTAPARLEKLLVQKYINMLKLLVQKYINILKRSECRAAGTQPQHAALRQLLVQKYINILKRSECTPRCGTSAQQMCLQHI